LRLAPQLTLDLFPEAEPLCAPHGAAKTPGHKHLFYMAYATQMPLTGRRCSVLHSKKLPDLGAPLRNRTVDLLLTMNNRQAR
jgi:hypothetical protein